jgi:riboflavin kinase/FMN adenylyltransferase
VGDIFRFGKKKAGTTIYLIDKGNELGFEGIIIPPVKWENEMVSSTRIREKLKVGEIEEVNRLLNVPYSIIGKVQKGRRIGTNLLGFPTANIFADSMRLFPPNGVYVTQTYWHEKIYQSVTNIGYNPTVGGKNKVIETFLLDFEDNLYDEIIEVQFLKWLRQEQKFQSLEELIDQMKKDVQKCRVFHDMI